MRHGRAHWFHPDELDQEQRAFYDRLLAGPRARDEVVDGDGRLIGPYNVRLLDPALGSAIQDVATRLRFTDGEVTPRMRELAILQVARYEGSSFEWWAHERRARAVGFTHQELSALRATGEVPGLAPAERLVLRVAEALVEAGDLDEVLFAEAQQLLRPAGLFCLVTLVGHYRQTALALRVWRVPIPDGAPSGPQAGDRVRTES